MINPRKFCSTEWPSVGGMGQCLCPSGTYFISCSVFGQLQSQQEECWQCRWGGGIEEKPAAEEEENPLQLALEKFLALIDLL